MQPKEVFGVVLRVAGLVLSMASFFYFVSALFIYFFPNYRPNVSPAWHYLLTGGVMLLMGLYLLRGGPHIVRFDSISRINL